MTMRTQRANSARAVVVAGAACFGAIVCTAALVWSAHSSSPSTRGLATGIRTNARTRLNVAINRLPRTLSTTSVPVRGIRKIDWAQELLRNTRVLSSPDPVTEDSPDPVTKDSTPALPSSPPPTSPSSPPTPLVVIPEDYRLGGTLLGVAFLLGPGLHLWWPQFFLHALLGGFLTYQTTRVRFRFSDTDLDVVFTDDSATSPESLSTDSSGENYLQGGGANKWSFKSMTNWEMWWPGFPVLVYFKETQTKPEGQPHFFPIIMDGKKLYAEMLEKMGPSKNAKPSLEDWNLDTALEATSIGRRLKEEMSDELKAKVKEIKDIKDLQKLL